MSLKMLFVFIACLSLSSAMEIDFQDCGAKEINRVAVEPCVKEPCDFEADKKYTVTGSFTPAVDAEQPVIDVEVMALGYWLPYPGIDSDPCKSYLTCPINRGKETKFGIDFVAVGLLHDVNTEVRIRIYADPTKEKVMACGIAKVHAV